MPLLVNIGNTCGINSLLQCLYLVKPDYCQDNGKHAEPSLTRCLYNVFKLMDIEKDNRKIRPNAFVKQIQKHSLFATGEQADVNELWLNICDRINDEIGTSTPEPELEDNKRIWHQLSRKTSKWANRFMGATIHITLCKNPLCNARNRNIEIFYSIPIQPSSTISDGLTEFFKSINTSDECSDWRCDKCGNKSYQRFTKPLMMPAVLVLSINRFNNDMTKNYTEVSINKRIRFQRGSILGDLERAYEYTLSGYINHYGVLNGGHYNCYRYEQDPECLTLYDDDFKRTFDSCDFLSNNKDVYLLFYVLSN